MNGAADGGHFSVVIWLHRHRELKAVQLTQWTMQHQGRGGLTTMVESIFACQPKAARAKNGHLSVEHFLRTHTTQGCTDRAGSMCRHLKVLHATQRLVVSTWTLIHVTKIDGDLTVGQWFLQPGVLAQHVQLGHVIAEAGRFTEVHFLLKTSGKHTSGKHTSGKHTSGMHSSWGQLGTP
ncbi:hypothetical protein H257_06007 [Aphanomyces astaci]|uniref:Uncharacterized protein n=1 Tax=Aphanomyces astaci TaxID=112090 RepID=W4GP69_APHAT|nr:hypothetical protein H257_06007 [Aphanomyces astaci]ETV81507.1 hypothetical protein H257_06007 [Aphanomyces astaci]|eukprot:XP_009829365.1 hypothetical protein H257_06007 [Aphanomyces astaci]